MANKSDAALERLYAAVAQHAVGPTGVGGAEASAGRYVPNWDAMFGDLTRRSRARAGASRAQADLSSHPLEQILQSVGNVRNDFRNFMGIPAGGLFSQDRRTPAQMANVSSGGVVGKHAPYKAQGPAMTPADWERIMSAAR